MQEAAAPNVFAPQDVKFRQDDWLNLYMEVDNKALGPLKVKRAFPLTAPKEIIVIENLDGDFLGIIKDYERMDRTSVGLLEVELEREFFLPQILTIYDIRDRVGLLVWRVETDRGPREFEVRNRRADIRWFSDTHVVIQDADGNKYEIENLSRLDVASRQKVEMEI
mgnify:FL=1|jgi:PAS domain-containing protein